MQDLIGYKNGMVVFASKDLLAQRGKREVLEQLRLIQRYPVKTDLSGNTVMVEGDSHEDAVQCYLNRVAGRRNKCKSNCTKKSEAAAPEAQT
jgi:hypothetical protein